MAPTVARTGVTPFHVILNAAVYLTVLLHSYEGVVMLHGCAF